MPNSRFHCHPRFTSLIFEPSKRGAQATRLFLEVGPPKVFFKNPKVLVPKLVKCYPGNRWKWSKQLFSKKTVKKVYQNLCPNKNSKNDLYQNLCPNNNSKNDLYQNLCPNLPQKVANSGSLRLWQIRRASFIHAESRSLFCSF